ncbi:reverse transcriptase domain, Reverse transcriptase zinc-binding domain protein [Artemisia annua]|uniref:Reverse transcriptase domain, Reverse transcriptase zinc-binding domain protein n=1 Tax=Artemisia annua TaxID=35608 RepID=A0A2U1L565_ARTAN|nr:reverse transcriptase domain, Reverse transcriptase zinc-binding domain protein [Artemisia annua]
MNIIRNWNCVVDCFKRRLSKWKAKKLSFGGRVILLKAALDSLPVYFFSLFKAPVGVIDKLEALRRRFFWGGDEDKAKTNWVAWDRVIGPCDKGGLGLGSLKDLNDGLMAKWWWRYKTEKGSVWRNVVDATHFNQNSWGYLPIKKGISGSWNMINKLEKEFATRNLNIRSLIKGSCGNGLDIRFWVDWWVGDGPLMECYPALFALEKQKAVLVAERIVGWDWRRSLFSVQEMMELQGCSTLVSTIVLLPTADRWKLLAKYAVPFYPFSWFKWVARKVSVFAWRAEQDRLTTYNGLKRRTILSGSSSCRVCGDGEEDAAHLFISCAAATLLWQQISSWCRIPPVYAHTVRDLFDVHNHIGCSAGKKDLIKMIILAGTWTI